MMGLRGRFYKGEFFDAVGGGGGGTVVIQASNRILFADYFSSMPDYQKI